MIDLPALDLPAFDAALATSEVGRNVLYHTVAASTMDVARDAANEGAPHGTLVFAEEQTSGRGRRGRSFYSPANQNL